MSVDMDKFDSLKGTVDHINSVREKLYLVITELLGRALNHDKSKTESPEKEAYDIFTPRLSSVEYGSQEYWDALREMKPTLEHHYLNNRHHPEFFEDQVDGMNLIDLLEMLCDWRAAGERQPNSSILKSIDINAERFNISPQLKQILQNTASYMEWI
jgi:hypothetical protein